MKLLVCGGRTYFDAKTLWRVLDDLHARHGVTAVIHGGAKGADTLAGEWAASHGVDVTVYYANWTAHGAAAGPRRSARMLADGKPDLVVAFPGGAGTRDMVAKAKAAGV